MRVLKIAIPFKIESLEHSRTRLAVQPIQAAICFLSTTSGLCSGWRFYVLLLAPLRNNTRVTFGCCHDALVMKVVGI